MIQHHPDDDLLLALAAGRLPGGAALLVSVHLEACAQCSARVHALHAVGGALLEAIEPQMLAPQSLSKTLERIDAPPAKPRAKAPLSHSHSLPDGRALPASLGGCNVGPWRRMGPGLRFSRVRCPRDARASLYLLHVAPGRGLASHTHSQFEFTQVLFGSFDDGRSVFGPGDFDAADSGVRHRPMVVGDEACVCLAYVEGRLHFDGRLASAIGRLIGM
jgi:putative transcriptional regulator